MLCPNCQFQNSEGSLVCQSCNKPLGRTKFSFWKAGFWIELGLILLLVLLLGLTSTKNFPAQRSVTKSDEVNKPASGEEKFAHPKIDKWETYSDPILKVSFEYPSGWRLVNSGYDARVVNIDHDCINETVPSGSRASFVQRCHFYSFYIEYWNDAKFTTDDPRVYVSENLFEQAKISEQYCKERDDCIGASPGFPKLSGKALWDVPKGSKFPAIGIVTVPRSVGGEDNQYFLIKNKRLYLIELSAPDYSASKNSPDISDQDHPLSHILRSLTFQ